MERNLSVELRPQKLDEFFGNEELIASIKEGLKQGRVDSMYIMVGPPGTGKTSLARAIIKHVNGPLDYYDITEPDTSDLDANELRVMISRANISPQWGKYKGFIVDEAQKLRTDVQSLLLKATEEPCPSTIWFICSSEPGKLNPALMRRGSLCVMKGLDRKQTKALVEKVYKHVAGVKPGGDLGAFLEALSLNEITSPGLILRATEKFITGVEPGLAAQVSETSTVDSFAIAKATAAGNWEEVQKLIKDAPLSAAKDIRGRVAGFFRSILVKEKAGSKRAERCVWAIEQMAELANQNQFEDGLIWSATVAALYKISVGQKEYIAKKG
jgi:DNA polymerase III delta prime subunit